MRRIRLALLLMLIFGFSQVGYSADDTWYPFLGTDYGPDYNSITDTKSSEPLILPSVLNEEPKTFPQSVGAEETSVGQPTENQQNDYLYGEYVFDVGISNIYTVQTIEAPDGNSYILHTLEDTEFIHEPGHPKLPLKRINVRIPADAEDIQLEIIEVLSQSQHLLHHYYPAEKPVVKELPDGVRYVDMEFFINQEFYQNNQVYPQTKAKIANIANIRGLHYAVIEVYPYQYDPATKALNMVEHIKLKLSYQSSQDKLPDSFGKTFDKTIKNLRLYNDFKREPKELTPQLNLSQIQGTVSRPADLLIGVHTDYLIITADDFYNSPHIDTLANYRASTDGGGYDVAIVKVSDIYITNFPDKEPGVTYAEDKLLKIFIKYAYDYWNGVEPPLEFILLVGDADGPAGSLVPVHISNNGYYWNDVATDYWYTCITDTYPLYLEDNHNIIDYGGDIYIGRFPVKTDQELQRVVSKTVNYETVFSQTAGQWRSQAGLIDGFRIDESQVFRDATATLFYNIREECLMPRYVEVLESHRSDPQYLTPWSFKPEIIAHFNEGRAVMEVSSHGSKITWSDGTSGTNIFHVSDVASLINNDKFPIVFSMACDIGWFDDVTFECLGEALLESSDAGAVASFFASRISSGTYPSNLIEAVFRGLFVNNDLVLGSAIMAAKNTLNANYLETYHNVLYNLLGDPALDISKILEESSKPDLTAKILGSQIIGEDIIFYLRINNIGSSLSNAVNILVEFFEGDPLNGGTLIEAQRIANVVGQAEADFTVQLPVPPNWQEQVNTFYLIVDRIDEIAELAEYNNLSAPLELLDWRFMSIFISNGTHPAIYANKIVWQDTRGGNYGIYMYDLGPDGLPYTIDDGGEQQISTGLQFKFNPDIHGNKIVWQDHRNGNDYNIYMYDLNNPGLGDQQITTDSSHQVNPAIHENKIVWLDYRNGTYGIYMYDLNNPAAGEQRIVWNLGPTDFPDIYADKIVYHDQLTQGCCDYIYLYDLSRQRESPMGYYNNGFRPAINNNKIVYERKNLTSRQIWMYDLGTNGIFDGMPNDPEEVKKQIGTTSRQFWPHIYGDKIAWQDDRDGSSDIYMYNLRNGEEFKVTYKNLSHELYPKIYGKKMVYQSSDGGVYMVNVNLTTAMPKLKQPPRPKME